MCIILILIWQDICYKLRKCVLEVRAFIYLARFFYKGRSKRNKNTFSAILDAPKA